MASHVQGSYAAAPPPPKQRSISMIVRVMDQVGNCYLFDIRHMLYQLQDHLEPYAKHLDDLLSEYNNSQQLQKLQEADRLTAMINHADDEIAAALISQVELILERCERILHHHHQQQQQQHQRKSDNAQRNIRMDHAREDKERMRSLYAWLQTARAKRQTRPEVHRRPQVSVARSTARPNNPIIRKRYHTDSEYNPDSSPDHIPRKVRIVSNSSKRAPVTVLDVYSDSDDTPLILRKRSGSGTAQKDSGLDVCRGNLPHPNALKTTSLSNIPRPRSRPEKASHQKQKELVAEDITRSVRKPPPTKRKSSNRPAATGASNIAACVLRAVGRHPFLSPLNHDLKSVLSRRQVQKYLNYDTAGDTTVAVAQDKMIGEVTEWWKARR